jgi:hypothetical protein
MNEENLVGLIPGGADALAAPPPVEIKCKNCGESHLENEACRPDDYYSPTPPPVSRADRIKALEAAAEAAEAAALAARQAALDALSVEDSLAEAKAAMAWDEKTGWPMPTAEDEAYAASVGGKAAVIIKGKVIARMRTPRLIRLERIAKGLPPLPVEQYETSPVETPTRSGPPGRKIIIVEFHEDYEGGLRGADVNTFESAAEAARLLGVTPPALSQAFKKANGAPVRIRGVTLQYLDLHIADDKNFKGE